MYRQVHSSAFASVLAGILLLSSTAPASAQKKATPTREVAPPGHEPYHTNFAITATGNSANGFAPDAVPADKRLVIEFVSARVFVQPGEAPRFNLYDALPGGALPYGIPLTFFGSFLAADEYQANQMIRLYHDGNGSHGPQALCARDQVLSNTPVLCNITISGYLIDK
jgi:hypothetical protein